MRGLSRESGHGRNIFIGDARIGYSSIPLSPAANGPNDGRRNSAEHRAVCFALLCGCRREDTAAPGEWSAQDSARIHRLRHANSAVDVVQAVNAFLMSVLKAIDTRIRAQKFADLSVMSQVEDEDPTLYLERVVCPYPSVSSFAPGPDHQVAHASLVET
jgi:hypothetical protein